MALKDFLALVDQKLHDAYAYIAPDASKARKPFIKGLDKAIKQFEDGKQPRGADKWWSANNNVVLFTPSIDGRPISIEGATNYPIPAERFVNALTHLKDAAEKGELDDQLTAKDGDTAPTKATTDKPKRKGWSPERHAAEKARREAAAAAKG